MTEIALPDAPPATRIEPAPSAPTTDVPDARLEDYLTYALAAGLAWAPFWLGGDRLMAWGVNAMLFPLLAIVYEASLLARGRRHPYGLRRIAGPALLFLTAVAWIAVQVSPNVPTPVAHPIWGMAADALKLDLAGAISVNPAASALALMRLITEASVFWLALQLGRDANRGLWLLSVVAAIVTAYCAYGLALSTFFQGQIPFFPQAGLGGGSIRSTFVNRNSFATYAGLGVVIVTAFVLRLYRHEVPGAEKLASFRLARLIEATGSRGALWLSAAVLVLVALLGTESRGGILSAAFGCLVILALSASRGRRRRSERWESLVLVAVAVLAMFLMFGDRVVGRIQMTGLEDASRFSVDRMVVNAIMDSPLLGFGYGGFADVFPMYRDRSISPVGVWDMAHNTYLEVWLGLGLVFGSALIGAVVWLAAKCFRGAMQRRQNATACVVGAAASALVGAHALVDFSLQIDAVALTYAALLGLGVAQCESSSEKVSD